MSLHHLHCLCRKLVPWIIAVCSCASLACQRVAAPTFGGAPSLCTMNSSLVHSVAPPSFQLIVALSSYVCLQAVVQFVISCHHGAPTAVTMLLWAAALQH